MAGLQDIGPLTETLVFVRGQKTIELTVYGITAEGLFYLMQKFPEIRLLMERRVNEITPERMMEMAPESIAHVIACALVDAGDMDKDEWRAAIVEQAKLARKMNMSDQLRLITTTFKVTFSEGVGPFVEQLAALMGVTPATSPTVAAEEPDMPSPGTLSASLVGAVEMKKPRGVRRQGSSQPGLNS